MKAKKISQKYNKRERERQRQRDRERIKANHKQIDEREMKQ